MVRNRSPVEQGRSTVQSMHSPSASPSDMSPPPPPPPRRPEEVSKGKNNKNGIKSSRVTPRSHADAEASDFPSLNKSLSDKENYKREYSLKEGFPMATSIKSFSGMPPPPPPPGPPPKRSSAPLKAKRNVSTKNKHNESDVSPGEEVPQLVHQTKEWDSNKVIPKGIVCNSPFTLPLFEAIPGQFMHQKNQWDMNRDIASEKVADVMGISPRLGAGPIEKEENCNHMNQREASRDNDLRGGIKVRSMSPKLEVPVRSLSPKFGPLVIQEEDNWNNEKEVHVEDPPQTRCQKKQTEAKLVIPPGVVELNSFGQKEWPSSPHGSSPKKTWTWGLAPSDLNDDAGAKQMDSKLVQLDKEKATATTEMPPSTGKYSPPASATHQAEQANIFIEAKSSASPQRGQLETNSNIRKGTVSAIMSFGSHERESLPDFESGPVSAPTFTPCQATAECSITEKSERYDNFLGTTPSNEGSKQWETTKEEVPTGKVLANVVGGPSTMQSSTENKSGPVASSFPPFQSTAERPNAEKCALDDGCFETTSSNEGMDTWVLPIMPSNQRFPIDETKWGASLMNSSESNETESGNDWFQSTSFGSETRGTDRGSKSSINAAMKHLAHGVTAMVSQPFPSSNLAPTQESSSAGDANLANSQTRDRASLNANPDDEITDLAGAEEKDTASKGKKRSALFNVFSWNKAKKDKTLQSKKKKSRISRSVSMKGDLSMQIVQSTSSQRKNEKAKQSEKTKASSIRNAATKDDQSVQIVLPVSTTSLQTSMTKEREISSNVIKTITLDTKKSEGLNPAMKLPSHFDKLHETAAPGFEYEEARLDESNRAVFKMGSNSLMINQNFDCEGMFVSETMNPTFFHNKKSMDSTVMVGDGAVFQESSFDVDSKMSHRQVPSGSPKISSVPGPFDSSSTGVWLGRQFSAATSQSNAIPTLESAFIDDNFCYSFPSNPVLSPKSQQIESKSDVAADDNADTGETSMEVVDTVSSNKEEDVNELATTTCTVDEFQSKWQAVPSGMTTYQKKARHATPESHRKSDSINANLSPSTGKLRAAPSPKSTVVAEDSTKIRENSPLKIVDMALSDEGEKSDELAKTVAGEAQKKLQAAHSDLATSRDKARDPVLASCTESDNVNTDSSLSNDKLRAAPLSSLTSPILLQRKRIKKKQRRKQVRESPLALVEKPSDKSKCDSSDESKCDPSGESTCDPASTDQTSQTSKGSLSTHLGLPSSTTRHSITSDEEKPQSVVTVSSGDQPTDQHVDDAVPDSLVRLHSSIQSERARLIAMKRRRNRVGKKPRICATVPPEKPSQSKGLEKSDHDVVPYDQQPSIVASLRASKSQPEIFRDTAKARSPAKRAKWTLPLEKQPESKEMEISSHDILPEAKKHPPVAATMTSPSDTRRQSKGTSRSRSMEKKLAKSPSRQYID